MATAKKLPSGNWRVQVYAGKDADGKKIVKSFTADTKREAEYLAADFLQSCKAEKDSAQRITFSEALETFITQKENVASPSTLLGYRSLQRNAYATLNDLKIDDITQPDIMRAVNLYAAGHSPKTVRNMHGLLAAVLTTYRPDVQISTHLPPKERKRVLVPYDDEINLLKQQVKGSVLEVPFILAVTLGLRESEISGLSVKNIYPDRQIVHVSQARVAAGFGATALKTPKSYSGDRELPCAKELCRMLIDASRGEEFVTPLTGAQISDKWHKLVRSAQKEGLRIRSITFHALRHYFASKSLLRGIPKEYLVELMGHASSRMLDEVYLHTFPDAKKEFAARLIEPQEQFFT